MKNTGKFLSFPKKTKNCSSYLDGLLKQVAEKRLRLNALLTERPPYSFNDKLKKTKIFVLFTGNGMPIWGRKIQIVHWQSDVSLRRTAEIHEEHDIAGRFVNN